MPPGHFRIDGGIENKGSSLHCRETKCRGDNSSEMGGGQATGLPSLIHLFRNIQSNWSHTDFS